MQILAFYPYVPYPLNRGAYQRGFYLLRELARSHEVDFLALAELGEGMEHRPVFLEFCRKVEFLPFAHPPWPRLIPKRLCDPLPSTVGHWRLPKAGRVLEGTLAEGRYDFVHIFDIILAQYLLDLPIAPPIVIDRTRVDLQYQLMQRRHMGKGFKARILDLENLAKLWRFEKKVAAAVRRQVVCGSDDAAFLHRHIRSDLATTIIPNGVDLEFFKPNESSDARRSSRPSLVFCGAMDYDPNIDALRWYFSKIHPRVKERVPDMEFYIVGKDPVPEVRAYAGKPDVRITGTVPDVRRFYSRAWAQIVPLRIGGGTRLKIVESMAMGTPVVSTTIGAQGLNFQHGNEVLLADTAEAFIFETVRILTDARLREQLAGAGLKTVRSRLSWSVLGQHLSRVYTEEAQSERATLAQAAL